MSIQTRTDLYYLLIYVNISRNEYAIKNNKQGRDKQQPLPQLRVQKYNILLLTSKFLETKNTEYCTFF